MIRAWEGGGVRMEEGEGMIRAWEGGGVRMEEGEGMIRAWEGIYEQTYTYICMFLTYTCTCTQVR